jgi:hypothetical protein
LAKGRKTGGRKRGSLNRRTVQQREHQARVREAGAQMLEEGVTPFEVVVRVMRGDNTVTALQYQAACELFPYCYPKITPVSAPLAPALMPPAKPPWKVIDYSEVDKDLIL